MRVILVFGTSGCAKGSFLKSCKRISERIHCSEIEAEWEELSHKPWGSQLDKPVSKRRQALEDAVNRFLDKPKTGKASTVILGVHATNITESMLSSALPLGILKRLNIDYCLTVHDDLYAVRRRLQKEGFYLNYPQLLLWRSSEHMMADFAATEIARTLEGRMDPPNFWLGVKHPKSTLHRLLFRPAWPKVYSGYSITGVLKVKGSDPGLYSKLIEETTTYRSKLHSRDLIVFDPATLDDRLLVEEGTKNKEDRWPYVINDKGDNAPAVRDPDYVFPIKVTEAEATLLRGSSTTPHDRYSDIDAQITQIDLRYVAQADFVTFWRPFNQGVESLGCCREAKQAHILEKPAFAYCPETDLDQYAQKHPSRPLVTDDWPASIRLLPDEEDFWDKVDNAMQKICNERKDCKSAVELVD